MRYRSFGSSGPEVSEIGFGAWGIGGGWGATDDGEAVRAIEAALERGITFFDTAMAYGDGHSEELIGRALGRKRDGVVIATKVSPKNMKWPAVPGVPISDVFPPDWIIECTEASLRRLRTDHVDVQQLHAWTPRYAEDAAWREAAEKLKAEGKVRLFGCSANDWDPYGATDAVKRGLLDSVQVIYNIFEQRPAEKLFPAALEAGTGIIVRVPFEEGLLTGTMRPGHKFDEGDWRAQWITPERLEEAGGRLKKLEAFLKGIGGDVGQGLPDDERPTLASLALKFVLGHPAVSVVIPGVRRVKHVEANAAVSDGKPLTEAELEALKEHAFVHGWQYPWSQA